MLTRILSAVVALAVVIPILLVGGTPGLTLLGAAVLIVCQLEFAAMSRPGGALRFRIWDVVAGLSVYFSVLTLDANGLALVMAVVVLGTFLLHLLHLEPMEQASSRWAFNVAGLFYAPLLLAFVPKLRALPHGLDWLFLVMIVTWAGDSGAYLAGRAFGKTPLYPQVSPKKTVEGLFGGVLLSVVGAAVAKLTFFPELSWVDCLLVAPVGDLAGVVGDLCESLLKRNAGVKDSGNIMPGHGGALDRLDSLFFSGPLVFGYAFYVFGRF